MQSSKRNLKNELKQAKPLNRLFQFGFTPEDIRVIQGFKDDVLQNLEMKLREKEERLSEIERGYKNGKYSKEQYVSIKKKAKIEVSNFKKKIKRKELDESERVLDKATNVLYSKTTNKMNSKFLKTEFIESQYKLLIPYFKEDKTELADSEGYKEAWREILKKQAHHFPEELATNIQVLESKRQAIHDLMAYYDIPNTSDIKKLKTSTLSIMLDNIDRELKELHKRVKDPQFDMEVRLRDAVTNEASKLTLGDLREKKKKIKERKELVKGIKESLEKGEKALNLLKINRPVDESRLFTPAVQLRFTPPPSKTQVPSNPLQLTVMTPEQIRDRRKSVHF